MKSKTTGPCRRTIDKPIWRIKYQHSRNCNVITAPRRNRRNIRPVKNMALRDKRVRKVTNNVDLSILLLSNGCILQDNREDRFAASDRFPIRFHACARAPTRKCGECKAPKIKTNSLKFGSCNFFSCCSADTVITILCFRLCISYSILCRIICSHVSFISNAKYFTQSGLSAYSKKNIFFSAKKEITFFFFQFF